MRRSASGSSRPARGSVRYVLEAPRRPVPHSGSARRRGLLHPANRRGRRGGPAPGGGSRYLTAAPPVTSAAVTSAAAPSLPRLPSPPPPGEGGGGPPALREPLPSRVTGEGPSPRPLAAGAAQPLLAPALPGAGLQGGGRGRRKRKGSAGAGRGQGMLPGHAAPPRQQPAEQMGLGAGGCAGRRRGGGEGSAAAAPPHNGRPPALPFPPHPFPSPPHPARRPRGFPRTCSVTSSGLQWGRRRRRSCRAPWRQPGPSRSLTVMSSLGTSGEPGGTWM